MARRGQVVPVRVRKLHPLIDWLERHGSEAVLARIYRDVFTEASSYLQTGMLHGAPGAEVARILTELYPRWICPAF